MNHVVLRTAKHHNSGSSAMRVWTVIILDCVVAVAGMPRLLIAQRRAAPPAAVGHQKRPASPGFRCPDPDAAKACASYVELRKAGDDGVKLSVARGGIAYVCFRHPDDAFFVLWVPGPIFRKRHFDTVLKKIVPDDDATDEVNGSMRGFVNGVDDYSATPIHNIRGDWTPLLDSIGFKANLVNRKPMAENDDSGVFIDSAQVDAGVKYKSRADKDIEYRLIIQRSTGRFVERYMESPSQVPFATMNGRCSVMQETS
jgi:hypothetical protein